MDSLLSHIRTRLRKWFRLPEPEPAVWLRTERLLLREFSESDWEAVLTYKGDAGGLQYMARTEPYTEAEVRWELRHLWRHRCVKPRRLYELAIELEAEQRLIGEINLFRFTPEGEEAVLGFQLVRDCWGRGYATEAAVEAIRFGFEELRLERMTGGCHPENIASRRVLERAGLPYWGTEEDFIGAPAGCVAMVFSCEREDWLAAHRREVLSCARS